jgi:hypothetical protein
MTPYQNLLVNLAKQFNLRDFVETGTLSGYTFRAVREYFDRAFTIDLTEVPGDSVEQDRFFFFRGSSSERLGDILQTHKITRALFWLDAHGNETFYKDDGNNQIPKELEAITKYAPSSLVVIDDITLENGKRWINTSYELVIPSGWQVVYTSRLAILHRGDYILSEIKW